MFGDMLGVNLNGFNATSLATQRRNGAITQCPKQHIKSFRLYIVLTEIQLSKIVSTLQKWHHAPHSCCA
eukprot:scaffold1188_cov78-Skeletonema_dohrnii-CCMP3373.AAC.4